VPFQNFDLIGGSLEAEEVGGFDEDLAAVVEEEAGSGEGCVVGIAGAVGQAIAKTAVKILQIVIVAKVDGRAGVGQPGEERLGGHLFCAQQ